MSKLKLLIAEDSKSMQKFYEKSISSVLYDTTIVADGELALAEYNKSRPDIILLDMQMPNMNGYQTLKHIRENSNDRKTTIIMISSDTDKENVIACAKLGIQGYIVKPFDENVLNQSIMNYHRTNKNQ